MINVMKILAAVIIVGIASVLQNVLNTKKYRRVRQFPMIFIAFGLMVFGVVRCVINGETAELITLVDPRLANAEYLILNVVLMAGFIVTKMTVRPIVTGICKWESWLKVFSLEFYSYSEEHDEWFLNKKWQNFRKYMLGVVCAMILVSGILLGLMWTYGEENALWMQVFPCAALVVLNEIYCYINGQTKEEFEHNIWGDAADARRSSNYYKLREILEQLLPDPFLTAHSGNEFMQRESAADMINELKQSEDTDDKITAEYFELNERYKTVDADCVQATHDMVHRRNVVFFNPFYRDLGVYITLPMVRALLSGKKCLVLCSRKSAVEDVRDWLNELLREYSHMRSLWRVNFLSDLEPECDVGILTFTQIYDKKVVATNREFLHETDFVLLVEPSVMLNTSQIALSILAEEMNRDGESPVYCVCDRYTDGLIDTLSHLLRSEITDVVAMPVPRCSYTAMAWNSDGDFARQHLFDKQTRFLGNGMELAAIAIKNQISTVTWYSEKKSPIKDIRWIAGQHYSTICRYMNQPSQQKKLYEKINFVSTLWSADKTKEQFVIVEDEFCNLFSMMRSFLSRGESQIFVNVLSENYLLRDYMRCNQQVFLSNPNAVPSFVPDYAKTERNTILKLVLMMSLRPVSDEEVQRELHLVGINSDDTHSTLVELLHKYTFAEESLFRISSVKTSVDTFTTIKTNMYTVNEQEFDKYFSDTLKNAYYILEDEQDERSYIDAKLFSHVTQTILPGQFVTYDGKYYQAKYVSPQSGVVLRRASDLYDGRKYYRQIRNYHFNFEDRSEVITNRRVMDIEFVCLRTNFTVDTTGYLELKDNHDLRTARQIDFSQDPTVMNYSRKYRNKAVLRIHLPDADDKLCFTICLLLTELFKSAFPDGWQYLAAITNRPETIDGMLNYTVYQADGDVEPGYIYIVEDSDVDLGLLDAAEKNFMKLMEIIADFLEWHFEKMKEPASKDPVPVKVSNEEAKEQKRRGLVVRMLDRIRKLFGGEPEKQVKVEDPDAVIKKADNAPAAKPEPVQPAQPAPTQPVQPQSEPEAGEDYEIDGESETKEEPVLVGAPASQSSEDMADYELDEEKKDEKPAQKAVEQPVRITQKAPEKEYAEETFDIDPKTDPDLIHVDGTDIFDQDSVAEDNDYFEFNFQAMGLTPLTKSRYQRECYLKYGFEEIDGRIQLDDLRRYLRVRGWCNSALPLARKREGLAKTLLDLDAVTLCDFCSLPLSGVSFERLNDGRIRCNDCSSSSINTVEEFKEIFHRCMDTMEDFYEIRFRVPIDARMTDARELAKHSGIVFKPSTDVAVRALGFAQLKRGKYSILIENGSPRLATVDTLVHEMTHIWQYNNWNDRDVLRYYAMGSAACTNKARDILYEGMAMWSAVQYLYQIGETYFATQLEAQADARQDVYGYGFRIYKEQYPLVKDSSLIRYTPFKTFPPVDPEAVKAAVKATCQEKRCMC